MKPVRHLTAASEGALANILQALPPLPTQLRYHDSYADKMRTIRDYATSNLVEFQLDGKSESFDLGEFEAVMPVVKHVLADWVGRFSPNTIVIRLRQIRSFIQPADVKSLQELIILHPSDAKRHWNTNVLPRLTALQDTSLRAFLHSLCNLSICDWAPSFHNIVRALPGRRVDRYRVVRTGECFLSIDHQAQIIEYIEDLCASLLASAKSVNSTELRDVCVLIASFQYGLRPGQIARIQIADVGIFNTGAVHIRVIAAKQRDMKKATRVTRRIKRDWSPLFIELHRRREGGMFPLPTEVPERLFFGLNTNGVSAVIKRLTKQITGVSWTPTENRHTAAQRLVDAGSAHIAVSEFMMHSSTKSANVYFDTSPTQAQRVNEAMAISPIYANVAKVAKTKTIDINALMALSPDQQIGGAPHGVR